MCRHVQAAPSTGRLERRLASRGIGFILFVTLVFAIAGIVYGMRSDLPSAALGGVAGGLITTVVLVVVAVLAVVAGLSILVAPVASGLGTRIVYGVRRASRARRTSFRRSEREVP
jgi:hypothetical protein